MYKSLFFDFDNTITDPITHKIPESVISSIEAAKKNGIKVFLATGRNTIIQEKWDNSIFDGLLFDGYISMNGQLVYLPDKTVLHSQKLDIDDVHMVAQVSDKMQFTCMFMAYNEIYANLITEDVRVLHEELGLSLPETKSIDFLCEQECYMMTPYFGDKIEDIVVTKLMKSITARWSDYAFDIIHRDSGKHIGMQIMLEHFGLRREEAISFGDGENDITMLTYAGLGVAMNHANDKVKSHAEKIAPPSHEDGIYRVLRECGIFG